MIPLFDFFNTCLPSLRSILKECNWLIPMQEAESVCRALQDGPGEHDATAAVFHGVVVLNGFLHRESLDDDEINVFRDLAAAPPLHAQRGQGGQGKLSLHDFCLLCSSVGRYRTQPQNGSSGWSKNQDYHQ